MANKQKVHIGVQLDTISNMAQTVNSMKAELDKLDISKSIKADFLGLSERFKTELEKMSGIASKEKVDIIDINKFNSSLESAEGLYRQMLTKLGKEGEKKPILTVDKNAINSIKEAKKSMGEYQRDAKNTTKQFEKLKQEQDDVMKNIRNTRSKEIVTKGELKNRKTAVTENSNRVANLKERYDRALETPGKGGIASELQALEDALKLRNQLNEATGKQGQLQQQLDNSITYEQQQKDLQNYNTELTEVNKKLEENKKSQASSAGALTKIQNSLRSIKGIDWTKLGVDPSEINSVEQLDKVLNKLKDNAVVNGSATLKGVLDDAEKLKYGTDNLSKSLKQAGEEANAMDAKMGQLNAMKQRITYFFGLQNAAMLARRAFTSVFNTIKELDEVMTETAVVTDFTVGDMWKQLPQYTDRANEFGLAIKDVYEADTLFYQQGLKTNEVVALSNETMKMARIAGLNTADATDRMTNALRGFNMELNETNAQNVADVYSELAAISASDVNELSKAMTKTASIASNAGASFENTAAFIAQIVETTRENAETAGTALKTVIARFTELKKDPSEIGEVDGEVVDANKIETALRSIGVSLRDANGQFRDFDDVILELSSKWDSLDTNTQRYIATIAAGSRQQSRFIALMSNNARLTQLTAAANSAAGASQKQYEKTLESLETKLNRLKNAANEFLTTIGNSDVIKGAIDMITGLIKALNWATSLGPRWIQMFTKTAAAIGLFVGLKKVVETGLAKIGATMGLQGAKAGTAYATAMQKAMAKNIGAKSAFSNIMRGKGFKESLGVIWKGTAIDSKKFKQGATDLYTQRRSGQIDDDQFDKKLKELGASCGMAEKQVDAFSRNLGEAAVQQELNKKAVTESTKSELKEVLANKESSKEEMKEALYNKLSANSEQQEILMNEAAAFSEGKETSENFKAALAELAERKMNEEAAKSELMEILANKKSSAEEMKEAMINNLGVSAEKAEWLANWKAAGAEDLETTENFKAAASEAAENAANRRSVANSMTKLPGGGKTSGGIKNGLKNFGTKAGNFLKGPGGYVAAAAAALAITAGIAVGVTAAIDASVETAEEKLENLTKRTELQAEATEQAISRLSESTSLVSNLEAMKEEISELTVGTAEWTAKVFELNSQMSKVISQYGQLADERYMTTSASGIMSLTEEGQEEYLRLVQQDALAAQARDLSLKRRQTAAQKEMAINSAVDTDSVSAAEEAAASTSTWIGGGLGAAGGIGAGIAVAKGGAAAGSFAGPLGALIGGVAGGIIGVTAGAIIGEAIKAEYNISERAFEDTINKASKEGFSAEGKTQEEIEQFLSGINATDSELASLREYLKESGSEFDKLTAKVRELNLQEEANLRQEASVEAQRLGLERGGKERFEDLYVDDAQEDSEKFDKLVEKELEAMADKYEVGFGAIFTDWNDTGEFDFDSKYTGIYEDFAKEMGWKFDANNKESPFIDSEGNVVDMSEWTDAQINAIVAEAKVRKELNKELREEQEIVEDKIRKDPNSIYNLLGSRMGVGKQEWLYNLTKEQIEGFNAQLNQVSIQGGDESAYSDALMNIANTAVASGMEMADVMDILAKQSVETKSDFWMLKDSLEQAADAQKILGFEIEDTLIEAAIDAADAIGNIDLKKLSEGAETIKELVDKIATSTDRVVTEEELKQLRGLGLRNSQYQIRDDGSAVITDPNWQFGLIRNLERQSIEDLEKELFSYNKYDKAKEKVSNKIVGQQMGSMAQSDEKEYIVSTYGQPEIFKQLENKYNAVDQTQWARTTNSTTKIMLSQYGYEYAKRQYEEILRQNVYDENIIQNWLDQFDHDWQMLAADIEMGAGYAGHEYEQYVEDIIENTEKQLGEANAKLYNLEEKQYTIQDIYDLTNKGKTFTNKTYQDALEYAFGIDASNITDAKNIFIEEFKKMLPGSEIYNELIKIAKNNTEFQSLLEGSWLGQEALNYTRQQDDDIEKIYSDKAADSLNTMVYQIEGATAAIATYGTQIQNTSSTALKAFVIENYKASKSLESLVSDVDNFASALSKPGTEKYYKALEEISQSVVNMGWANSLSEGKKFFDKYYEQIFAISKGGEEGQRAYEAVSKAAADAAKSTAGLGSKLSQAYDQVLSANWEIGKAHDLVDDTKYAQLFDGATQEQIKQLANLYEIAGFTVTVDFNETGALEDFLIKRNSVEDATGGDDEQKTYWIEYYDKFYNLQQDINAELRTRAKLEREINKALSVRPDGTVYGNPEKLHQDVQAQLDSVNLSLAMNEKLKEGRIEELKDYMKIGEEQGWTEYAKWDKETNTVRIDRDGLIDLMGRQEWTEEEGSQFNDWLEAMQNDADAVNELDDTIADDIELKEELLAFGRNEYMELEKKVYEAIINREKELIESMQSVSDSIEEANSDMLQGLQKSINKLRQDRQNQDIEKDISDEEQRLAYLSSSTTADPLEIMKLEEKIIDARQNYTDQLIDQKITELEDQNEQARVQREKQIAIAQAQLDYNEQNGHYWAETYEVLNKGIDSTHGILSNSQLMNLLKSESGWSAMSEEQQKTFLGENQTLASAASLWMKGGVQDRPVKKDDLDTVVAGLKEDKANGFTNEKTVIDYSEIYKAVKAANEGKDYTYNPRDDLAEIGMGRLYHKEQDKTSSKVHDTAREYTLQKDGTWKRSDKNILLDGKTFSLEEYQQSGGEYYDVAQGTTSDGKQKTFYKIKVGKDYKWIVGDSVTTSAYQSTEAQIKDDYFQKMTTENALVGKSVFGKSGVNPRLFYFKKWYPSDRDGEMLEGASNGTTIQNNPKWKNTVSTGTKIKQAVVDKDGGIYVKLEGFSDWIHGDNIDWGSSNLNDELQQIKAMEWKQYKTGGLADFTGPAWLDGTKSAPEIVLNAQDTKNFLQLRDILSDLFKGGNFERSGSSGDNYYDIDINVDEISNDYDVDQLAARIKQQIVQDSMYRNVNTINLMR